MATTIKDRTRLEETTTDLVGATVDKYEVVGVVGQGGMGRVYEAINTAIQKSVAMKCIDHELAKNPEATARFQREALAASAIESPHIVQIFDAGVTGPGVTGPGLTGQGLPYIVMELLRGRDLGKHIAEHGRLPLSEALVITAQLLKGLHHAHAAGIVHRDLKPDNVFLVQRDDEPLLVKLLDFGVSKISRPDDDVPLQTLTRQGTVVGTPYYMSPEQAQAFPDVDQRTDLYSAGAILYECLTGRAPHVGRAYEQVIVNICMHDADDVRSHNAEVPDAVAEFLIKALAREREDRFASARDMLAALEECAPTSIGMLSSGPHLPVALASLSSAPARDSGVSLARDSTAGDASGEFGAVEVEAKTVNTPLGGGDTPPIVPVPSSRPANELADTVGVAKEAQGEGEVDEDGAPPAELTESGISTRMSHAAETVRSESLPPTERRRRPLAIAAGIALFIGAAVYLGFGRQAEETEVVDSLDEPAAAQAEDGAPEKVADAADGERVADDTSHEADGASTPAEAESSAEPGATAEAPTKKTPGKPPPAAPTVRPPAPQPVAHHKPVPAPTKATSTAEPVATATNDEPSLQLQVK